MKKLIFLIVIFFTFQNCNKVKNNIKEKMHIPDYSYKEAGIDQFYYSYTDLGNTPVFPLIKPFKILKVGNPREDEFGHMYTKEQAFVWNWFEDLESINFIYNRSEKKYMHSPSGGFGPSTTTIYTEKIYKVNGLKHNTQFKRVIKNRTVYHQHALNEYENYQF